MSVYAQMLEMVNSEQDIAQKQTLNQYRLAEMTRIANQVDTDRQTRLINQQYQQAQDAAQLNAAGQPMPQYGFQPGGAPVQSPEDANPDMASIHQELQQNLRTYQQQASLAAALRRGGGSAASADKADDNARDAMRLALESQSKLLAQRKDLVGEVGSLTQSAGPDNFAQVAATLDAKTPGWARGKDLDTDLTTGAPVWGPRTAQVMGTMAKQSVTAYQQMEVAHQAVDDKMKQQDVDRKLERVQDLRAAAQKEDAYHQELVGLRERNLALSTEKTAAQIKKLQEGTIKALPQPTEHEVTDMAGSLVDDPTFRDLTPSDRKVASRDLIRMTNKGVQDALRADPNTQPDVDAIRSQAMATIKSRVTPEHDEATKERTTWSYLPFTDPNQFVSQKVPPKYNISGKVGAPATAAPAAATPEGNNSAPTTPAVATPPKIPATATSDQALQIADNAVMQKIAAVGIKGSVNNGNVYGPGGGKVEISNKAQFDALPKGTPFVMNGKSWIK